MFKLNINLKWNYGLKYCVNGNYFTKRQLLQVVTTVTQTTPKVSTGVVLEMEERNSEDEDAEYERTRRTEGTRYFDLSLHFYKYWDSSQPTTVDIIKLAFFSHNLFT